MTQYRGGADSNADATDRADDGVPPIGILLANLGTPEAPTAAALKTYLREFLSDPRVIEVPRWKWKPILECFILTTRPRVSAHAYQQVWTDEGSPLLVICQAQARGLEEELRRRGQPAVSVAVAMRYGNPSISQAVEELSAKGCRRLLLLPLYPQYSAATCASTFDALAEDLRLRRWVPELRTVMSYHNHPGYIDALAATVTELWAAEGPAELLLISFHGLPQSYADAGDPYADQCQETGRLLIEALGLSADRCKVAFQSRFGKEPWLQPYTDVTLKDWGREKLASVDVICPGFPADCVETLEEIDQQNRAWFEEAGGGRFRYVPALNTRPAHVGFLADLAGQHLAGWIAT